MEGENGEVAVDADTVVTAVGFRPRASLKSRLVPDGATVYEIGDQRSVATILQAIWDGFEIGNNL